MFDLAHEDATHEHHFVRNRIFKISDDLFYPENEHPILSFKGQKRIASLIAFTIWHLGSSRDVFISYNKYKNHLEKSTSHTPQFLRQWYKWYMFGTYPTKVFNPVELPKAVKDRFEIIDDEIYFEGRGLELKHFIDCNHWIEHFKLRDGNKYVLFVGDGVGVRTFAMKSMGIEAFGFDISTWAVENNVGRFSKDVYWTQDIVNPVINIGFLHGLYDLVVVYDVLEHINYEDIDMALDNIYKLGKKDFLFSIPFKGENQDLYRDNTHKIFEDRVWWTKKLESHKFKIKPTPTWFNFMEQILVAEK